MNLDKIFDLKGNKTYVKTEVMDGITEVGIRIETED